MIVDQIMTKNPISIEKDSLAVKALSLMSEKKLHLFVFTTKKTREKQ